MSGAVLTTPEAAKRLRVGPHTIGRLVRSGQLQYKQIGNRYLFREEWLIEFLENPAKANTDPISPADRLRLRRHKEATKQARG